MYIVMMIYSEYIEFWIWIHENCNSDEVSVSFFGQNPSNPWWLMNTVIWIANSLAWPCWMDVPHTPWFFQRFWHVLTHRTCPSRRFLRTNRDNGEYESQLLNICPKQGFQQFPPSSKHHLEIPSGFIKHGWLDNPLEMEVVRGKSPINGPFSSKPCLITGG